jgi:hypothetical protein
MYFLYKNESMERANDADHLSNQVIVSDIDALCGGPGQYALFPTLDAVEAIRHNVNSLYMFISIIYVLFLMALVTGFNAIYISYFLKEHQVPLIFRNPDSNLFYDIQRAKILFYLVFIVLSGVLGSLNFYDMNAKCLHTYDESLIRSDYVDLSQYSLTALLWIVSVPMMFLACMVGMRDNMKFGCYPIVIANIIFAFMLFVLSQIVLIESIIYSQDVLIRSCHAAKYGILLITLGLNLIYRVRYAKEDITAEDTGTESGLSSLEPSARAV